MMKNLGMTMDREDRVARRIADTIRGMDVEGANSFIWEYEWRHDRNGTEYSACFMDLFGDFCDSYSHDHSGSRLARMVEAAVRDGDFNRDNEYFMIDYGHHLRSTNDLREFYDVDDIASEIVSYWEPCGEREIDEILEESETEFEAEDAEDI